MTEIYSEKEYDEIWGISDDQITEADRQMSDDDMRRMHTMAAGDPVGDYVGHPDIQLVMIIQEHAYQRRLQAEVDAMTASSQAPLTTPEGN